jgi:hypothetical protein
MTGGRACSICRHPEVGAIQRAIGEGVPLVDVCSRFEGIKKSALHRHMTNHTGRPTEKRASRPSGIGSHNRPGKKSHPADGRCDHCGQLVGESADGRLEPKDLIRRAERMLWTSETVATRALDGDDNRLVLLALDRVKSALETLMKAHGMLGPDVQVNIDNRQVNQFAGWSTGALQALQTFHDELGAGKSVKDACTAILAQDGTKPGALNPGRSEDAA